MPMPKPGKKETQEEFVARFMGDEVMKKDYKDQKQRYAVAMTQWKRRLAKNSRRAFEGA